MPSGRAPIAETSSVESLLQRRWSHRRSVPTSLLSLLTAICWAVWFYLVLPLVGVLLWILGIRLFVEQMQSGGFDALRQALMSYAETLLVIVGLLALWILWNVVRYGGAKNRRNVKQPWVTDLEVSQSFRLDDSLLETLRGARRVRVDVDEDECVVLLRDRGPGQGGA